MLHASCEETQTAPISRVSGLSSITTEQTEGALCVVVAAITVAFGFGDFSSTPLLLIISRAFLLVGPAVGVAAALAGFNAHNNNNVVLSSSSASGSDVDGSVIVDLRAATRVVAVNSQR